MSEKEKDENEEPEFAVVTLESLTELLDGDEARAAALHKEISTLGGFGVGLHGSLGVNTAPPAMQKKIRELIEKRAAEEPDEPEEDHAEDSENKTSVVKTPAKDEGKGRGRPKKTAPRAGKRK